MTQIIYAIIYLLVTIGAFFLGKYITPKLLNNETINVLSTWVYKFVVSAQNQHVGESGEIKLEYVTDLVKKLCTQLKINLTDDQIRALIEDAYKTMKDGEKQE